MHKAATVLSVNSEGQRIFKQLFQVDSVLLSDVGVKTINHRKLLNAEPHQPLRILWSGLFEPRKALHLLIMALAQVPSSLKFELRILGDGPLKESWQKLARQTGVETHCTWMGWVPHKEALAHYEWADIFVFSSLRDSSGTVILEAFSHGVPVICLGHQGPCDMVTPQSGVRIPVTTTEDVVSKLRDAIVDLAANRHRLINLSEGRGEPGAGVSLVP